MILTIKQSKRFMNLLLSLLLYSADELGMDWFCHLDEPELEDLFAVYARIWGPDGRRDLVDRFAHENPRHLKWADLKEVSSWSQGLFGRFQVMRDGSDVFCLVGGHAFTVRGLIEEADSVEGCDATYVESLLLPFDGVITYGIFQRDLSRSREALGEKDRRDMLEQCRRDGHVVRGARQFVRPAAAVREVLDKVSPVTAEEMGGVLARELHVGSLAGLSWEERRKVLDEDARQRLRTVAAELVAAQIDDYLVKGEPAHTYPELLSRFTRDYLLTLADHFHANVTRKTSKAKLVEAIAKVMPLDDESLLGPAVMEGVTELERVRRVFEAGGRIDADESDFDALVQLPVRSFPVVSVYRTEGGYAAAMVDEAIESLSSADFDGLLRRAADFDLACQYATLVCDFRGVERLQDVVLDCMSELGVKESPLALLYAFSQRRDLADACEMVELDGESYLVASRLAELWGADELNVPVRQYVNRMNMAREGVTPRSVVGLFQKGYRRLWDYLFDQEAYQTFAAYLDAHIPDGESDLRFAEELLERVCTHVCGSDPASMRMDSIYEIMARQGLVVPAGDGEEVEGMLNDLLKILPSWYANGWPFKGRRAEGV